MTNANKILEIIANIQESEIDIQMLLNDEKDDLIISQLMKAAANLTSAWFDINELF